MDKIIDENNDRDNDQCAAAKSKVRVVSGFGGKLFIHSTRKDKNLKAATRTKVMRKVRLNRSINLANFLTF